jgi:hypothetical protein
MRKTLILSTILATLSLSLFASAQAQAAPESKDGWITMSSAERCVHKNRVTPMYSLNGEMRKTQCFTLQSKKDATGKRVYQNVSRDGSVTIKGKRLA